MFYIQFSVRRRYPGSELLKGNRFLIKTKHVGTVTTVSYTHLEDYWLSHLFETCSKIIPLENFCNPVIKQIAAKKQTGAASPLEILTAYLESDRQLTQAAETLHMHRNNVLYHITRLEKEYNLEMDDSDKRLHLQISLKIWQYLNDCK